MKNRIPKYFQIISLVTNLATTHHQSVSMARWRHEMETFSALLALWEGNSPVTGEFPSLRPATRSFDVFFDLRLNKRLSKQWRRRYFETPLHPTWRHCNGKKMILPPVDAIVRGDIPLRNYTTQFIIGRVSTAPQIAKDSTRHRNMTNMEQEGRIVSTSAYLSGPRGHIHHISEIQSEWVSD